MNVQKWKFVESLYLENQRISFLHYGYDEKSNWLKAYVKTPNSENLDHLFNNIETDLLFYGHNHEASDFVGKARYINLGSAGCYHKAEVRIGILEVSENNYSLKKLSIPYEDDGLMEEFEIRKVPARAFIKNTFITRDKKD